MFNLFNPCTQFKRFFLICIKLFFQTNLLLMILIVIEDSSAYSAAGNWVTTKQSQARLIASEETTIDIENSTILLGVHIRLEEGWETYWRTAGAAGFPPVFDWSESSNIKQVEIKWPVPEILINFDTQTFGYRNEVVFPVYVKVLNPSKPLAVRLNLTYGLCKEVCIQTESSLELDIPLGFDGKNIAFGKLISKFIERVPKEPSSQGMAVERAFITNNDTPFLEIIVRSRKPLEDPKIIIEGPQRIFFREKSIRLLAGGRRAIIIMDIDGTNDEINDLINSEITVILIDQSYSVESEIFVDNAE